MKIGIIGVGNVGATIAYTLATANICNEIVISDIIKDKAKGVALDISQAVTSCNSFTKVVAINSAKGLKNCDIVVITAGLPRIQGMSREELVAKNRDITAIVSKDIAMYAPNAIVIQVSNPLDVMVYVTKEVTNFPRNRVFGMAGVLDSARMAYYIYEKLGYGLGQINSAVIGSHNDTMIPLPKYSSVGLVPLSELLSKEDILDIVEKTKKGGAKIVQYLNTSAYYAPAMSVVRMIKAIIFDSNEYFPTSVLLEGEYGFSNVATGVIASIGKDGIKEIKELSLSDSELKEFKTSVEKTAKLIEQLKG